MELSRRLKYFPLYSPKVPVPDGENVLLVKQHQLLVVDDATIQFSVIRLTQGDDMYLDRTVLKWKITVALYF